MTIAFRPARADDLARYAATPHPYVDAEQPTQTFAIDVDGACAGLFSVHAGSDTACVLRAAPDADVDALLLASVRHAFDALAVRRLQCAVVATSRDAIERHLRCGFAFEGIARQACRRDGAYVDVHQLALLAADWQRHVRPALIELQGPQPNMAGRVETFELTITPKLVDAYSAATGDDNPVHLDDEAARRQGFAGRIAHGMLLGGAFSKHFANEFPGPGTIYVSQSLQFLAPVPVGAQATVVFTVESHIGRRITVQTQVLIEGRVCVDGIAVMMLPKGYRVLTAG